MEKGKNMQLPRATELSHGNILIFSATLGTGIFVSLNRGVKLNFTELSCLPEYLDCLCCTDDHRHA